MNFFLYYFNYSEFNLENLDILYFGAYTIHINQKRITSLGSYELLKKNTFLFLLITKEP